MPDETTYSIGRVASFTGVTVRTLQYYDNIGLLPIARDQNGRRYYRAGDLAKLQQILFYRSLGLPLQEIRELVVEAATPEQVTDVLTRQRETFYYKLNEIQSYISLIDAALAGLHSGGRLGTEELLGLISNLNRNAVFEYRNVNFNKETKELLIRQYGDGGSTLAVYWQWKAIVLECASLILGGVEPRSEAGKRFAEKWLVTIERITQGDPELLAAHKESYANRAQWPEEDLRLMEFTDRFIDEAVAYYLESVGAEEVEESSDRAKESDEDLWTKDGSS